MNKHEDSMLEIHELGSRIPPYRPTFDFPASFIDRSHRYLANCPVQDDILLQLKNRRWFGKTIPGWLRREDGLKLYEMAYYASGDILELGSYQGLSTSILARANRNSPARKHIYTLDLEPGNVLATMANLRSQGLHGRSRPRVRRRPRRYDASPHRASSSDSCSSIMPIRTMRSTTFAASWNE